MFRFSIRELMLLTAVVALAVGWWSDRSRLNQWRHQENRLSWKLNTLKDQFEKVGGNVTIHENSIAVDYAPRKNIASAQLRNYYSP